MASSKEESSARDGRIKASLSPDLPLKGHEMAETRDEVRVSQNQWDPGWTPEWVGRLQRQH